MNSAAAPSGEISDATALRVFYAFWPDPELRSRLAEAAAGVAQRACGRAVRAENLHLTLAFVGEVAADRVDGLRAIGAQSARAGQPFALTLDCAGHFRRQGIAWLGPSVLPEALARMARDLGEHLGQAGFRTERRTFAPHVTLARRCTSPVITTIAPIGWRVDALTLVASTLKPQGPDYRLLARWPLATR